MIGMDYYDPNYWPMTRSSPWKKPFASTGAWMRGAGHVVLHSISFHHACFPLVVHRDARLAVSYG